MGDFWVYARTTRGAARSGGDQYGGAGEVVGGSLKGFRVGSEAPNEPCINDTSSL